MKLIIRRGQKSGMISSKITFWLDVKSELTAEEDGYVKKYRMGDILLYKNYEVGHVEGFRDLARAMVAKAMNIHVTVNDLIEGKHIECKDIVEIRVAEDQIKEAAKNFKDVLETAAHFEGEEIIEYA